MSEVKGRIDRDPSSSSAEAPAALSGAPAETPMERGGKRPGTLSLGGWMGALLDKLSDDELPRS